MFDEWLLRAFLQLWSWLEFLRKPCAANRATLSFSLGKQRRRNWEINNTLLGKQQMFLKDFDRLAIKEVVGHSISTWLLCPIVVTKLYGEMGNICSCPMNHLASNQFLCQNTMQRKQWYYMLYTNSECHKIATGFSKNKRAMQNVKKNTKPAGEDMSYS